MDKISESQSRRAKLIFRICWYLNLLIVIGVLLGALYFFSEAWSGPDERSGENITLMASMLIIAIVLLMGAAISHYQSITQRQHFHIVVAIDDLREEVLRLRHTVNAGR